MVFIPAEASANKDQGTRGSGPATPSARAALAPAQWWASSEWFRNRSAPLQAQREKRLQHPGAGDSRRRDAARCLRARPPRRPPGTAGRVPTPSGRTTRCLLERHGPVARSNSPTTAREPAQDRKYPQSRVQLWNLRLLHEMPARTQKK